MKQYLLLIIALSMFASVAANAMKHNANDSAKLANFLLQPVGDGLFTNAKLILGPNYTGDWMIDTDWISKITSDVINITWTEVNNEKRIKSISTGLTSNAPSCLSGTLDMSDCDWLETVNLPVQLLDKVKFDNCKELQDVILMNNAISSASFNDCERLEAVNLGGNHLLFSKIEFPSTTTAKFDITSQTIINPGYSVDVLNNELWISVDLRDETKIEHLTFTWDARVDYHQAEPGLYYLKNIGYSISDSPILYINRDSDSKIEYEAICTFNNHPGTINITTNTPKDKTTVDLYLRKENTTKKADVLSYDPIGKKYFATLPKADYVIQVSAEGYCSTYYSDCLRVVTNWEKATTIPVGNGANPNIEIRLTEATVPIGRIAFKTDPISDNSTIVLYEKITDHEVVPVDTILYTDDAYYSKDLRTGNYIAAVYSPDHQFTYYNTDEAVVANWQRASVIPIEESGDVVVWVWLHQKSVLSGNVSISGRLKEPSSKLKAAARPFKNATVLLSSSSSETAPPIASTIADEETGEYSFANLPSGTYTVSVEIAGFTSENITINAQAGSGQYVNNDFIVNGNTKTVTTDVVLATPEMKNIELAIYPNPATDVVRISGLEGTYTIKVISLLGQSVISTTGTSPELTLNLSGQPSGLYLVRIETQVKLITRKLIKK